MMHVQKMESIDSLTALKQQYMQHTTAPLDGMWLCGFVPLTRHFGFYEDRELIGFFCVNDDGYLMQFFVQPRYQQRASPLFASIIDGDDQPAGAIRGAFVSTAEPRSLSLCLDRFTRFDVNALMYQHEGATMAPSPEVARTLTLVDAAQLSQAVDFAVANIGAPAAWLRGYFTNLIHRRELFGVWDHGKLIATGEARGYDAYQTDYADVGVIVAKAERGQGLATCILKQLVAINDAKGLKSICSTERANIAAQKAIARAGFFAGNRILQFHA